MKKRIWIGFVTVMVFVVSVFSGCSKSDSKEMAADTAMPESSYTSGIINSSTMEEMEYDDVMEEAVEEDMAYEGETPVEVKNQSKIIRRVNLYVETLDFDEVVSVLTKNAEQYGGYVENSDVTNKGYYGNGRRYGYFTVRIPAADADAYMESMGDKGVIVSKSENLEDVTLQYVDTKSHIEMLQVERERLMELLEKAINLEEILMIEERLTSIRYELESYESQLKVLDNKVNYTTINIDISEVEQITTPEKATLGEKIVDTFKDSIRGIVNGMEWLAVFFIGKIPYLVILAGLVWGIVIAIKRKKKMSKKD